MTSLDATSTTLISQEPPGRTFDEQQMPAASFLARDNGPTLATSSRVHSRGGIRAASRVNCGRPVWASVLRLLRSQPNSFHPNDPSGARRA
jgi:hypothetical protein